MKKTNKTVLSLIGGGKNFISDRFHNKNAGQSVEEKELEHVVKNAALLLASKQKSDGHWIFELEADVTIPAEYVMLQRFINRQISDDVRTRLSAYLLERQLPDGGWPLYNVDGDTNISASVKAYFALKLLGHDKHAPHMLKAKQVILTLGGAAKCNVFTRITLALFGQIPWHTPPVMPIEIMLLPRWFFFHLNKIAYWSRTVIVPLLILYAKQPVCRLKHNEGIVELFVSAPDMLGDIDRFRHRAWRKNFFIALDRFLKRTMHYFPRSFRKQALEEAETWTRTRMKGNGGIGAIYPAMANAIMALKTLGCNDNDPDYIRGLTAIDNLLIHRIPSTDMATTDNHSSFSTFDNSSAAPLIYPSAVLGQADDREYSLCQPCNSPIWDTCLSLSALTEAAQTNGTYSADRAMKWLFDQQITTPGDWSEKCPGLECGGWAFQYENVIYPDVDDTSKVLMALFRAGALEHPHYHDKISKAVKWVLGMQSSDGGWGAFDVDNNHLYLNDIPFADHGALLDPSTSDLTGRCIEMLGMLGFGPEYPPISRGISFLKNEQEKFGGWFGRWGVNYIYGTWSVLSGLHQAGEDMGKPYIRKAVEWLMSCQNTDDGWGETCASYDNPALAGSGASTASQTAWALLGLMAAGEFNSIAVRSGIQYLLRNHNNGWDERHFTGTGFPRVFYLRYHGYCLFFPVWALGVYASYKGHRKTVQENIRENSLNKTGGYRFMI